MKTVSVKQVATALGVTPRAVIYKLEKGGLKGTRTPNQYGVQEWRIYPTREIAEKLKSPGQIESESTSQELDFEPDVLEAVEAESINTNEQNIAAPDEKTWIDVERERLKILAEEMTRPLVETIRQQERIIEEQKRELRLLPDLERRAEFEREQAAKEREASQLVSHERDALEKQVAALQAENATAQEEKAKAEATISKLAELEQDLAELKIRDEALRQELDQAKKPFWKKLWGK